MFYIIVILTILIDQITKYLAINLSNGRKINIVGEHLQLMYLENRGAAFGILQNQKWILLISTIIVILYLFYVYFKYKSILSNDLIISLALIVGGAIGNLLDRIMRGYVIDFISYTFPNGYHFPVFNVADMAVVTGSILLLILTFVFGKGEITNG